MRWVIDGDLLEVQGGIERALDAIEFHGWKCQRIETSASREYQFTHPKIEDVGRMKLSVLPQHHTELYGYSPDLPDDRWLVEYLSNYVPWKSISKPLWALLQTYSWQMEHKIFNLSARELLSLAHSNEPINWGWSKYGLDDEDLRKQAMEDLNKWRKKIHKFRVSEFKEILGVIESQIRSDGLLIKKPGHHEQTAEELTTQPIEPWNRIPNVGDDRGIVEMWCGNHTNKEIAQRFHRAPRSITNTISRLRSKYPDAKIPTDIERRKSMINK